MGILNRHDFRVLAFLLLAWIALPSNGLAQGDEIQVYDGGLADVGQFNLTWHNNFTPKGLKTPSFPGAVTSDKSFNGVTEWAWGVTKWFEAGLYLPLYSIDKDLGAKIDGFKIRTLFASPRADDRKFFYGSNFEFSYNSKHWDQRRFTSEIRPIIGWHLNPVDVIFNPIMDTAYTGGLKSLEFVPATRIAYNKNQRWALAVEEYSDYGEFREFSAWRDQSHQIYGVIDRAGKLFDLEAGVGVGITKGSDKLTLKLILSRNLN